MAAPSASIPLSKERTEAAVDALRATFGFPAALAMIAGLLVGLGLPQVDHWLNLQVPLFAFSTQDAARSMLETIATATVSVAGISFSVTIVAFTLSANQLSPRVLRSFRRDLTSQLTLAAFLGTFIYCLAVLVRLGSLGAGRVPNLSIAVAVALALVSFALFAAFIGHIANMLQPSSIIASIVADARSELKRSFPTGLGNEPRRPPEARREAERQMDIGVSLSLRSERAGFLTIVRGQEIIELAAAHDALVRQCLRIGDYVLPGRTIARVWASTGADRDAVSGRLSRHFELGTQRTTPQDPAFPIRQLADVALKGLSPGINDPTTAANAMEAMSACLIEFGRADPASPIRLDSHDQPRFIPRSASSTTSCALVSSRFTTTPNPTRSSCDT